MNCNSITRNLIITIRYTADNKPPDCTRKLHQCTTYSITIMKVMRHVMSDWSSGWIPTNAYIPPPELASLIFFAPLPTNAPHRTSVAHIAQYNVSLIRTKQKIANGYVLSLLLSWILYGRWKSTINLMFFLGETDVCLKLSLNVVNFELVVTFTEVKCFCDRSTLFSNMIFSTTIRELKIFWKGRQGSRIKTGGCGKSCILDQRG